METEHRAAARLGIEAVRESRFHAGALIQKGQWSDIGGQVRGEALAVLLGLDFHADESHAFFLGFDDAGGLAVHIEEIVRKAVPAHEGKISEDYAPPGMKICALVVLNSPACLFQRLVDVLARLIFWGGHGAKNTSFPLEKSPRPFGEVLSYGF